MQKTFLLSILNHMVLCMKVSKCNYAFYGVLFIMMPYALIVLQNFSWNQSLQKLTEIYIQNEVTD